MPSPSKKPPTNVKPVPGTIVWVRRRNGSWWPGRIISKKELLASNVMSPRSGTPVKLLGRDDASVDWYNIEKSKRVKAFRCGEFDDCIEKAQAMAGMQNKRREKYARREDAIVDAIELEKEQNDELSDAPSSPVTTGKKVKVKGKQKSGDGEQSKKDGSRKPSKKHSQVVAKEEGEKAAEGSEFDDLPILLPRMRGLQDLVSAGTSSKISGVEGLEGSCEVPPPVDETKVAPESQARLTKRKRTSGRAEDAPTSKRRDKKKTISQVLETSQRDEEPTMKPEVCDVEEKHSDEGESMHEALSLAFEAPKQNAGHVLDAHSANNNGKSAEAGAEAALPSPSTCPSPTALATQEKSQGRKEKDKGSKKKKGASAPRTLASLGESELTPSEQENEDELSPQSAMAEQKSTVSGLDGSPSTDSKGKTNEETVTECPSPAKSEDPPKEPATSREGLTGPVHSRSGVERQSIPVIRLFSTVIQNSVQGYPISVEVVDEIPLRRTAKRTTRQRTPRDDSPMYEDSFKVPGMGKAPKRSKEALSKKLLKRAVSMTSKKIRTLASISEERGRHPLGLLSSELPPRWPVATSVPVSVAMSRLRAVVCS